MPNSRSDTLYSANNIWQTQLLARQANPVECCVKNGALRKVMDGIMQR